MNDEMIAGILNKTEVETICVSNNTIGVILDLKSKNLLPKCKHLITFDLPEPEHFKLAKQVGFSVYSYDELVTEGLNIGEMALDEPTSNSILILGITSGTTGEPKAAMLTHLNFISGQVCQDFLGFNFTSDDIYLSYVPLTHVYEQIMITDSIIFGFRDGFSSGNIMNLVSDI